MSSRLAVASVRARSLVLALIFAGVTAATPHASFSAAATATPPAKTTAKKAAPRASAGARGATASTTTLPAPPPTRVEVVRDTLHGTVIEDPYRWLEDKNSPQTRAWLETQIAYTTKALGALPGRESLRARVEQCLKVDNVTTPTECGGRYFFTKRTASQDLPVLYMRKGLDGADEVLVDPHPLSPDHTVSVNFLDIVRDGSLVAYGTRAGGEDELAVTLLDTNTRQALADKLPKARYFGISIKPDRSGFYYSKFQPEGSRVYYHAMGTDPATDKKLFGDGYGPDKIPVCQLSEDGRWLQIIVYYGSAGTKVELYAMNVAEGGPIVPIVNDIDGYFEGAIAADQMYIWTNWQAPHGRVLLADLRHPARDQWKEIVPTGDAVIEGISLAGGKLCLNYLKDVASSVRVFDAAGKPLSTIDFPTMGSVGSIAGRWASNEAFFTFQSFHVPRTIFRVDLATGARTEWWRAQVPIHSEDFQLDQVWYASKDGTRVPMFVLHKKGIALDGSHPTLLTGYGGFLVNLTPSFSATASLWVERGGVFAQPNLRGGGELGEAWHEAGMLGKKQNVFDDFIGAAEWLEKSGYTSPAKLSIEGGSNGGLLVGAALTQRPELFQAVICDVPLLDMLRYHQFLVARFWVPEYGSSEDPDQFKYLYAYSPYQHVKKGVKYPAVMLVTGDSDTRVDPLHARKMAALLQASTGSDRPILLHYDTKLGHAGGKPVSKQIEDTTDDLMFLQWQLGMGSGTSTAEAVGAGAAPGK